MAAGTKRPNLLTGSFRRHSLRRKVRNPLRYFSHCSISVVETCISLKFAPHNSWANFRMPSLNPKIPALKRREFGRTAGRLQNTDMRQG